MLVITALAITAAGFAAGAINTIVGSGSLITYPVMVFFGVPPVTANIANTVGLVPGSVAGAWGYRNRLGGTLRLLGRLGIVSVLGAVVGAILLTRLPKGAFELAVPLLILAAALLVGYQPKIIARTRAADGPRLGQLTLWVFLASVYGGYFSAAQGVILLGLLGVFLPIGLQEQNAIKNVLQAIVNIVAAVFFVAIGGVAWFPVVCIAVGSVIGAPVGAVLAQRIPARPFRIGIVIFGIAMAIVMAIMALA